MMLLLFLKKISNAEERKRLKVLIESIRPKNFGVIVRTAAEGKKVADLHEELTIMMQKWEDIHQQLYKARAPMKLLSELDKTSSILRDILSDDFNKIVVNEKQLHQKYSQFSKCYCSRKSEYCQLSPSPENQFLTRMALIVKSNLLSARLPL